MAGGNRTGICQVEKCSLPNRKSISNSSYSWNNENLQAVLLQEQVMHLKEKNFEFVFIYKL